MTILITGAFGQLGKSLIKILGEKHNIIPTGHYIPKNYNGIRLNIQNKIQLKEIVKTIQPDLIINLAAITDVDKCEEYPQLAKEVNIAGLENICNTFGGKIIQLSTDYVFDGKSGPYNEEDEISPISVYGKTKSDAEKILLDNNPNHLVIRGNVLYSGSFAFQASFLSWVVNSLREGKKIEVVNDQYNNPTWTQSMSDIIELCISRGIGGIIHWGDADYLNRYEFARLISKKFELKDSLIEEIKTKDLNQIAARPLQSGLLTEKATKYLNAIPPTIEQCLDEIIKAK